ncbi:DUF2937 family protein [Mangrovicella endophytica]|uniref:DUF2937 family protein n=1 Tax=Mangrovicella endophytica TaxID=2066697 RepID=UPI000C9E2A25|nr:DUF2937 family protein [Mangrovicella endophytica]
MSYVLRLLAALLFGFVASQSAEFTQQYLQRLGGAADELRRIVQRFDEGAASLGLSRQQAVGRLVANPDAIAVRQGEEAVLTAGRYADVERRYRTLREAAPLQRPFLALSDPDWDMLSRTGEDYRPALPVTMEGVVLTLAGFALGWAAGAGAAGTRHMLRRRRLRRKAAAEGTSTPN